MKLSPLEGKNFTTKSGGDIGRQSARPTGRSLRSAGPRARVGSLGSSSKALGGGEPPPSLSTPLTGT